MYFITGDTHGDFRRIEHFCYMANTTKEDVVVILGDAGINYDKGARDRTLKRHLEDFPITLFCLLALINITV